MFSRSKRNEEQIHVWQGKPPVNLLCTCQDNVNYSIISPYHRLCFGSNHWSKMNSVRSCCMSVFVFLLERLHARSVRALGFGYGDQIIWCFLGLFMPSSQSDYPPPVIAYGIVVPINLGNYNSSLLVDFLNGWQPEWCCSSNSVRMFLRLSYLWFGFSETVAALSDVGTECAAAPPVGSADTSDCSIRELQN